MKIYTLNEENGISTPFPNEYEQAEFDDYEYTAARMGGAPSITAKIKHRLCLDDLWTEKQYVEFRGCKYFVRDTPSSSKDNNDTRYEHDITFLHERFVLENVYMLDSVFTDEEHPDAQPETDKYVSNSTKVIFWGDIHEFVGRFNACLHAAGLGGSEKSGGFYVVVDEGVTSEETLVAFEDKFFSEALQEIFNTFKLPYYWVGNCCHIGLAPEELSEVFEYGRDYALLSIEKQNTNQGYCNRATGVGSSDNIPYYYPNVQAPDATIPHAVEGNKGITDDRQLSLVADENARKRWNDMDSVADNERPWKNRGLVYIAGSSQGLNFNDTWSVYDDVDAYSIPIGHTTNVFLSGKSTANDLVKRKWWEKVTKKIYDYDQSEFAKKMTPKSFYGKTIYGWSVWQNHFLPIWNVEYSGDFGKNEFDWVVGSNIWSLVRFAIPFKFTDSKGGSRVSVELQVMLFETSWDGTLEKYKPQALSVDSVTISPDVQGQAALQIVSFNPKDDNGRYILTFDVYDVIRSTETTYQLNISLNNETGKLEEYQNGLYLYRAAVFDIKQASSPSGWYKEPLSNLNERFYHRDLSYWGVESTQTPTNGDRIVRMFNKSVNDKIIPVSTNLMPTIYRETSGEKVFYNALNEDRLTVDEEYKVYSNFYKDEHGNSLEFEHEFVADNQREAKYTFDDIKPTIKGMVSTTRVDGKNIPMNTFIDVAYDYADNDYLNVEGDDEDAEFAHSYFFVKLPKTKTKTTGRSFNLFASADENGNDMVFSVTSGSCGGCNFKVMVDEKTKSKNPVLVGADGELLRDPKTGNVLLVGSKAASGYTYQDRQQNTETNEVWIALKKETDTYGIIMPNASSELRVKKHDTFVILNIHLPLVYIEDAEDRLSKAIIAQMQKDNSERFSFNISFSRVYMEENPIIARSLTENAKIYVRYNGLSIALYVNNYSFKMSSGSPLPEISVDLNDEIAIGSTYSQNRQGDISEPISSIMGGGGGQFLPVITSTDKVTNPSDGNVFSSLYSYLNFLSKKKDDNVEGNVHFHRGIKVDELITTQNLRSQNIEVGDFLRGMTGANRGLRMTEDGDIFAKNLFLEEGMSVPSLKMNRAMGILGYFIVSIAGGKVKEVQKDALRNEQKEVLYQQVDQNGEKKYDGNGNPLTTTIPTDFPLYANSGWVTLDLENGELGAVEVGDMLLGFWHGSYDNNTINADGVTEDGDLVRNGDIMIGGFQSIYFYVDEVDEEIYNNGRFHYTLRCEKDASWRFAYHPQPELNFYGFGNQILQKKDRQSITIMSREYTVRLINKSTWTYDENNIIEIHGKLDGFSMFAVNDQGETYVKRFTGYGNVMGNAYIFGQIDQFERVAYKMEIDTGGDTFIGVGETKTLKFSVVNGYGVEQTPKKWSVTRSSSKPNDDRAWNSQHKSFSGTLELTLENDFYGIDRATFTVVATMSDERTAEMIVNL
ncbi:MAG: hypothetical protein KBT34_02835 [Prevotella sp.]|nr:hypothetical protein [Candidatus Prevotella equi]